MIHPRIFRQAIFLAFGLQVILTLAAFVFPVISGNMLLGLRIVAAAFGGYLYGAEYEGGYYPSAMCGALISAISIVLPVAVSVSLGIDTGSMIPVAIGAALLSGGLGGALGAWVAQREMQFYK